MCDHVALPVTFPPRPNNFHQHPTTSCTLPIVLHQHFHFLLCFVSSCALLIHITAAYQFGHLVFLWYTSFYSFFFTSYHICHLSPSLPIYCNFCWIFCCVPPLYFLSVPITSDNVLQLLATSYQLFLRTTVSHHVFAFLVTFYHFPTHTLHCLLHLASHNFSPLLVTWCLISQLPITSLSSLLPIFHHFSQSLTTSNYFKPRLTTSCNVLLLLTTWNHFSPRLTITYRTLRPCTSHYLFYKLSSLLVTSYQFSYHILPPPVTTDVVSPSRATSHYLSLPLTTSPYSSPHHSASDILLLSLTSSCHMSPHWPKLTKTHHLLPCVTTMTACHAIYSFLATFAHWQICTTTYRVWSLLTTFIQLSHLITTSCHALPHVDHVSPHRITSRHFVSLLTTYSCPHFTTFNEPHNVHYFMSLLTPTCQFTAILPLPNTSCLVRSSEPLRDHTLPDPASPPPPSCSCHFRSHPNHAWCVLIYQSHLTSSCHLLISSPTRSYHLPQRNFFFFTTPHHFTLLPTTTHQILTHADIPCHVLRHMTDHYVSPRINCNSHESVVKTSRPFLNTYFISWSRFTFDQFSSPSLSFPDNWSSRRTTSHCSCTLMTTFSNFIDITAILNTCIPASNHRTLHDTISPSCRFSPRLITTSHHFSPRLTIVSPRR